MARRQMQGDELRAAIRAFREGPEELTPVINVNVGRDPLPTKPDSDAPAASGVMVTWKKGVRLGKLPPWATVTLALVLGLAAIGATAWAWVKTH